MRVHTTNLNLVCKFVYLLQKKIRRFAWARLSPIYGIHILVRALSIATTTQLSEIMFWTLFLCLLVDGALCLCKK